MNVNELILAAIRKAVDQWINQEGITLPESFEPTLELPKLETHGDLATNVSFQLGSATGKDPKDIARSLSEIIKIPPETCDKIEVAGAGFINFYLSSTAIYNLLREILVDYKIYGKSKLGAGKNILIEFVSANPTGPLTIAHARQAAVGDILADILEAIGFRVKREYYLNDRGRQMELLARSTRTRYMELLEEKADFPEEGYRGEYILDIARSILKEVGNKYHDIPEKDSLEFFLEYAKTKILDTIKKDLLDFGVKFNSWVSEKELVESGRVEMALKELDKKGYVYGDEGAQWFSSTKFGDDKDRVLIKSSGEMTYLAPDIAYHRDKYSRGFRRLIDIWGPDHHGYTPRIKAAVQALGHPEDSLSVLLVQLTTLYRDGKPISMSTRAGEFVSLRDLISEVGSDASRYYLVMRRPESHLDFDLEVAKRQSPDNPVYYIQYAHARISSIFKKYEESNRLAPVDIDWSRIDITYLKEPEEISLIKYLSQYPIILQDCARVLSPHLLTDYLEGLVSKFHNYYEKHRVIGIDSSLTEARIALVRGIQVVLKNALKIMGVSVPEKM